MLGELKCDYEYRKYPLEIFFLYAKIIVLNPLSAEGGSAFGGNSLFA
jgi:hypothetical protein